MSPQILGRRTLRDRDLTLLLRGDLFTAGTGGPFVGARGDAVGFELCRLGRGSRFAGLPTTLDGLALGCTSGHEGPGDDEDDGDDCNDSKHVEKIPVGVPCETQK